MKTKVLEFDPSKEAHRTARLPASHHQKMNQGFPEGLRNFIEQHTSFRDPQPSLQLPSGPTFEVRSPLISFIEDLTEKLRECSNRYLRPSPEIGIRSAISEGIDLSDLLSALEAGEKRFDLLSQSRPSLDSLVSASRHIANQAGFMVRGLRRSLITSNSDPAHPGQQSVANVLEAVDTLSHNLIEMRLSFEDLAAGLYLQMRTQNRRQI